MSSPIQIWRSRISWRIALSAFLTILVVQISLLTLNTKPYHESQLQHLKEMGKTAVVSVIGNKSAPNLLMSPVSKADLQHLISSTVVKGITIYSLQFDLIESFGEPSSITLTEASDKSKTFLTADGHYYDTVLEAYELTKPYYAIVRLDSSGVQNEVIEYVKNEVLVMLLLSALVTTVLMIALGHWLLEPILFMRSNLLLASENPENPEIPESPYDEGDEIGGTIKLAQNLIRLNTENLKYTKSTAEDKIHKLAYFDTLTRLPNRTLFLKKLSEKVRASEGGNTQRMAILAIDLDHFKDVNDTMGHNVGDAILRSVGKRLAGALPVEATLSRSGEDEFAITVPLSDTGHSEARAIAEKVLEVIRGEPFRVFNEQFQISASIGMAVFPDDGLDPDLVLKNADIALNRAKEEGRNRIKQYSEDFDRLVQQRFQILRDLRDALENNQLDLFFQPQLDLRSEEIIGAEALIRWWKPDNSREGGSYIPPFEFIPIAEQSGLIVPIGEWVLERACDLCARWSRDHGYEGRIAVNVSAVQFSQNEFIPHVKEILERTGLHPSRLELEVTESVFMEDIDKCIAIFKELHSLGIELAIDDFGTGYSSLSYLRQFPIDRLKIDQSFIRNALSNPDDAAIAKTIVALGHSLNMKVIAEGVETKEHEEFLFTENCDEVQGYRYSKPVPEKDFIELVESYTGKFEYFDS